MRLFIAVCFAFLLALSISIARIHLEIIHEHEIEISILKKSLQQEKVASAKKSALIDTIFWFGALDRADDLTISSADVKITSCARSKAGAMVSKDLIYDFGLKIGERILVKGGYLFEIVGVIDGHREVCVPGNDISLSSQIIWVD